MLVSIAVAMGWSYPSLLLAGSPTAGLAAYPHHVWTSAKPLDHNPDRTDVEMRQVWIYGSTDQALNKSVLKCALTIQQTLLGLEDMPSRHNRAPSGLTWDYHSPLLYWNNSASAIDDDQDILNTIHDKSKTLSSLNVALRPASVFAGKKFDQWKLQAADALVITLMNKVNNGAGGDWESRMSSLSTNACKDCRLFPADGHITRARVYEFSFTPLNWKENLLLTFAYTGMALYVLLSLRRLKAFHSRFGLVCTAITQITFSLLSSITVCDLLKINLSMVPKNAYPFVVLVIGLENMFRVINAILAYPPTMATPQRIANALGDIGPLSVATVVQNLVILFILSRFVSPGVGAFCAFAGIATLFDFYFLNSFFLAVLNVDIRRLELQDALSRTNSAKAKRRISSSRPSWFDALVQGRLPFSTRMAGTAVTTTFILSLNYHFFERHEQVGGLRYLLSLVRGTASGVADFDAFTPPPMNATLTPGEWMRMQDFETAREVMRLAKPGADSFVIRLFAPLIVVLPGADRTGAPLATETWTHALHSFAIHHFFPVVVAVIFGVAFVAVLMNYLLYGEAIDSDEIENDPPPTLIVQTVEMPHRLDIVKLFGTNRGHFVSIGLDRTIAISTFDQLQQLRETVSLSPAVLAALPWPIHAVALSNDAEWIAFHCNDNKVYIYSRVEDAFVQVLEVPDDHPFLLFEFTRIWRGEVMQNHLILLTSGGRMMQVMSDLSSKIYGPQELSPVPLLGAAIMDVGSQGKRIYVATETARLVAYNWMCLESDQMAGTWTESNSQTLPTAHGGLTGQVHITSHLDLGSDILVIDANATIFFIDALWLAVIAEINVDRDHDAQSSFVIGHVQPCIACGSAAIRSVAVANDASGSHDCDLTTWTASETKDETGSICLRKTTASCISFDGAQKTNHKLADGGTWHALSSHYVLGLRKRQLPPANELMSNKSEIAAPTRLRHRRIAAQSASKPEWEAYRFSLDGELESVASSTVPDADHETSLYVNSAGPTVPLDAQSVAVAFGNTVKIVRASHGSRITTPSSLERKTSNSRRRVSSRKGQ